MKKLYCVICSKYGCILECIPGCISVSAFLSLVGIAIGITSSGIGLKICAITAGIWNHNSLIEKKKKKHDKIA